jgi:predicted metal-binding membrane protein
MIAAVPQTARTLPIGAPGPSFEEVLGTDGGRHSLRELAGPSATVLIFTANRCPTAKSHVGRLEAASRMYEPRGVRFVLINSNDPYIHPEERLERSVARLAADGLALPYLADSDQSIARSYGPTCTFHAFVLDGAGILRYEGRFDDARLEERVTSRDVDAALDAILAGRAVPVPRTPAFGCALEILGRSEPFLLPDPAGFATGFAERIAEAGPTRREPRLEQGLAAASAGAWALTGIGAVTGGGLMLSHDALIHGGPAGAPPVWLAIVGFLLAWQVMLAAMMVPASAPAIGVVARATRSLDRPTAQALGFVGAFAAVWAAFGLLAFAGDWVVHQLVNATPWLAAHPQVIGAGILATAGVYQLTPWKRRGLDSCRDPLGVAACCRPAARGAGPRAGVRHAVDCLAASWALMLLMFAVGPTDLAWMIALTGVMAYEVRAADGIDASPLFGVFLLSFAVGVLSGVMPLA